MIWENNKKKNNDDTEIDNECGKLFLGWISDSWIAEDTIEACKWHKHVIKEHMQHMASSWEERNKQVHDEKRQKENN